MTRTLFVGDVHGCAAELGALLREAAPTRVVLLGDLFTKGPSPAGVWDLIEEWGAESVLGNHDAALNRKSKSRIHLPGAARTWLAALPLMKEGDGPDGRKWLAVHAGIDPVHGRRKTTRHFAINGRRYPDDSEDHHRFWWDGYRRQRLVVYGHDARRGLVDRRPWTLGLDSGCVYGGALTGYMLEQDKLIQIPAGRMYVDPKGS